MQRYSRLEILEEIKRTASANGGVPLGWRRFNTETGIELNDLYKTGLPRYSDACVEAGFSPNRLTTAYDEAHLLDVYAKFAQELGRLPAKADHRVKEHADSAFPSETTLLRRGSKRDLVKRLAEFCRSKSEYSDVLTMCEAYSTKNRDSDDEAGPNDADCGFVYLLKHGSRREYKIGKTVNVLRREGEIGIELPERVQPVHVIKTDDPAGIEAYWHRRFDAKRKNGEWFELNAEDVAAFKRRKFM